MNLKDIRLNPDNPRFIKDDKFKKLCQSIKEFPKMLELRPIIVDSTGLILGGNMRFRAITQLGLELKDEWFKEASSLTDEEKRRFIVEDNVGFGEWDWDKLSAEFEKEDLEDWGLDIDKWKEDEIVEDEVPEVTENPVSKLGEVYQLGRHRIMCGDSTKIEDVEKLMDGKKADMVFTDPPYGNGDSGVYGRGELGHRYIEGDENFDVVEKFINLNISTAIVFFLQWRTFREAIRTLDNNKLKLKTIGVWDKKNSGLGSGLMEQWEAILFAGDIKFSKFGGNVFTESRESGKREDSPHPHQKPIKLLTELFSFLDNYKTLFDPFLGSGSTLIACEQTNRICYGMEIDPKYIDVIRKRYAKFIGKEEEWEKITPVLK